MMLGPVRIVLIAGLIGIIPSLLLVLCGVEEPRIVGPSLLVPVLLAAVATWFRERIDMSGSPWMLAMEQRDERIESEGVEYAVLLGHLRHNTSLLEGMEMFVSLSRYALRE